MNEPETVLCDGVTIGKIGTDAEGKFVGYGSDGTVAGANRSRHIVYQALVRKAVDEGKLVRVRKGHFKAATQ